MRKIWLVAFLKYQVKQFIPQSLWLIAAKKFKTKREREFTQRSIVNDHGFQTPHIYLIRRRPPGGGLFSNVNHVLQGIEYAKKMNMIPIVDMQNYWTSYSQSKPFNNSKNSWEYFFKPVSEVKISEIAHYKYLTLSKGDRIQPESPLADLGLGFVMDNELLIRYSKLYSENIKINEQTQKFIDRLKDFLEWESNTVGVFYRGTDYVATKPKGHAKQPSLSMLLSRLESKLDKESYSRLFISTEDNDARKRLHSTYSSIAYKEFREKKTIEKFLSNRHSHSKQTIEALGYLAEIYLLSECRSITCSIANGSASALLINGGKYLNPDILNLGVY
jgi:hypothetical protein